MQIGNFKITDDGLSVPDDDAQIEPGSYYNLSDPDAARKVSDLESRNKARDECISPPGSLGLPPLLERRRLAYRITDGAFKLALNSDRVFIKSIPEWQLGKMGRNSLLHAPETVQSREMYAVTLGILVAAGPKALDELRSNGIDLGHRVKFIRDTPWKTRVDRLSTGQEEYVLVMNSGDIIGSEDLAVQYLSGKAKLIEVEHTDSEGRVAVEHQIQTPEGRTWNPIKPWQSPDYV